jgi:hypothetical protein
MWQNHNENKSGSPAHKDRDEVTSVTLTHTKPSVKLKFVSNLGKDPKI